MRRWGCGGLIGAAAWAAAAAAAPVPADVPDCRARQLGAEAKWHEDRARLVGTLRLINTSRTACAVRGRPRIAILDRAGRRLDVRQTAFRYFGRRALVLGPNQKPPPAGPTRQHAQLNLLWERWCGATDGAPLRLRVTPSGGGALTVAAPVPAGDAAYPACGSGRSELSVSGMYRVGLERYRVTPRSGGPATTFTFRYRSTGPDGNSGDYLRVYGPPGTRCRGEIVGFPTGFFAGVQTIRLGPFARTRGGRREYVLAPERRRGSRLWCRGLYRGLMRFEGEDLEGTFGRFFFRVR
jgi:hypothetical protein